MYAVSFASPLSVLCLLLVQTDGHCVGVGVCFWLCGFAGVFCLCGSAGVFLAVWVCGCVLTVWSALVFLAVWVCGCDLCKVG